MTTVALVRQRRQERRCTACGIPAGAWTLCSTCRVDYTYCPSCERVYPSATTYASRACNTCERTARQKRIASTLRDCEHPLLRKTIRLYRRGLSQQAIADELIISASALRDLIHHARRKGQWPDGLTRRRGQRTDLTMKAEKQ